MAVLLDNFLSASTAMEREERREEQGNAKLQTARDSGLYLLPLEPLLLKLTRDYVDSSDLNDRLAILYQVPLAPDHPPPASILMLHTLNVSALFKATLPHLWRTASKG